MYKMNKSKRINKAISIAVTFGGIDGAHHKDWVIDQMLRALADYRYDELVEDACEEDGDPTAYVWDVGIAP